MSFLKTLREKERFIMKKRFISMVIIAVMILSIGSVQAVPISDKDISVIPFSDNAIDSVMGRNVSTRVEQGLKDYGIDINDDSLIEIIPVLSNDPSISSKKSAGYNATAIVVTNLNGSTVTKDALIMVGKNGLPEYLTIGNSSSPMPRDGSTVEFPYDSWDGRYVVRGTAVYNTYYDGIYACHQPVGAYFTYRKNQTCNTYVTQYSPATNYMYSTTNQYNTNRVIWTNSGSPFVGQFLTFNTTVDGKSSGYTIPI